MRTDYVGRTLAVSLVMFAVGLFVGSKFNGRDVIATERVNVRVDTLTHIIEHQPTYIVNARARVDTVRTIDTLIVTPPFVARLDTVVVRDTIRVDYAFPQHTFNVALRRAADSIRVEWRTVTITEITHERRPWLMDALTHFGAGAIGYAAGRAIK